MAAAEPGTGRARTTRRRPAGTTNGRASSSRTDTRARPQPRAAPSPNSGDSPIADQAAGAILGANPFLGIDPRELVGAAIGWVGRLARRPAKAGSEVVRTGLELGRVLVDRSEVKPGPGDKRFADPAWTENPLYRRLMQAYLAVTAAAHRLVDEASLSPLDNQRAHMGVTLLSDALAPTNGLLSNPAALKRAFDTAGVSLLRGAGHFVKDLRENGGMPATVDNRPFQVGGNLAVSPGAVVYRDEVFELIQYAPTTEAVRERPVIIIPPQINKYYVMDIAPGRSFTEHVVGSGITYFTISWRNPSAAQRDWGLDTYVQACVDAIDAAIDITGSESVNFMGLCAGGLTMALLLGYLAAAGKADRVASATFGVATRCSSLTRSWRARCDARARRASWTAPTWLGSSPGCVPTTSSGTTGSTTTCSGTTRPPSTSCPGTRTAHGCRRLFMPASSTSTFAILCGRLVRRQSWAVRSTSSRCAARRTS